MSRFKPVHLPEDRRPVDRVSQSFLRHYQMCPRSGYLYALTKGQARTVEMMRGAAGHAILERATRTALEQNEPMIPGEIVKVIVDEVLAEFPVPFEEHDYLRELAYRWAAETAIDPQSVIAVETLFTLEVGGWHVRCKVDRAELLEGGAVLHVVDYKTGRGAPPWEKVARKLTDPETGMPRWAAKNFQLVLYALAVVFGVPVRVEECGRCGGSGRTNPVPPPKNGAPPCPACGGSGRVETPEPFPLAARAQRMDLEFVYPGVEDREGKMARQPMTLTRAELEQYRASLEGLVARVRASVESGDWPAVMSDDACDECPAKSACPIPAELHDHRGTINTPEQAAEAFEKAAVDAKVSRALTAERRAFVKANGAVRFGDGMVAELVYSEHEEVFDKEGMFAAMERTVRYGEPFERWRYVRTKGSNRLVVRALTAEELGEMEGSDGIEEGSGERGGGDGGGETGRGVDRERERDERFGSEAPF